MNDVKDEELAKRVDDIRSVRAILAEGRDTPLIYPWAFAIWAILVALATTIHLFFVLHEGIAVKTALLAIWLPALAVGAAAESISFVVRAKRDTIPLFNHRLGNAILGSLASFVIAVVILIGVSPSALSPGIAILLGSLALVFYAQISWSRLFIETWIVIGVGITFELTGAAGTTAWAASGYFCAVVYAISGIHAHFIERGGRA